MKILIGISLILITNFAEAGKLMQMIARDPSGVVRTIYYENQNGYSLIEGDILIARPPKDKLQANIVFLSGRSWVNGEVPFLLKENLAPKIKEAFYEAVDIWHKNTSIKFIEISKAEKELYTDYVYVDSVETESCYSNVGRIGGKQLIILSQRCTAMKIAHELGHTLGLWHEHSRQDRDQYIEIIWENISEPHLSNFNQHFNDGIDHGSYNYDSIMHYSSYAFTKNGKKTIVPKFLDITIGQRDHLSKGDIAAINMIYNK